MRIVIADDHEIVRTGLRVLLSSMEDVTEIVEAETYDELLEALEDLPSADLAIVDLYMPGMVPVTALSDLTGRARGTPIAIFSMSESLSDMRAALAGGARAYIPKTLDNRVILGVLRLVLDGGTYIPPVLGGIQGDFRVATDPEPQPMPRFNNLTRRQHRVLELLAEGLSNKEIADRLGLTLSTVKTHVTDILKALGVDNRTRAVLMFNRAPLVTSNQEERRRTG